MLHDNILEYLETVDLKTKMRGYDQIEVDEIFDRVTEEIKTLRENLKNSEERERIAVEHLDSEIKRLNVREKEVEGLIKEAEEEAIRIIENSRLEADNLRSSTEKELHLLASEEREKLTKQLSSIENRQNDIQSNVDLFEHQFSAHRERILRALGDMQKAIKELSLLPDAPNLDSNVMDLASGEQLPNI
jgi:DivIVA domain-containing protein